MNSPLNIFCPAKRPQPFPGVGLGYISAY